MTRHAEEQRAIHQNICFNVILRTSCEFSRASGKNTPRFRIEYRHFVETVLLPLGNIAA